MKLVIDANVLFSALIKKNITQKILLDEKNQLFAPKFILEEFYKHQDEILAKTKRSKKEFEEIYEILKEIIALVYSEDYIDFLNKAEMISPDRNDIHYFALALKLKCPIWSNDKVLKKQKIIEIYNTEDIIKLIKS